MVCSQCGWSNPGGARFCNQCGLAVAPAPAGAPSGDVPTYEAAPPTVRLGSAAAAAALAAVASAAAPAHPVQPPASSQSPLPRSDAALAKPPSGVPVDAAPSSPSLPAGKPVAIEASTVSLSHIGVRSSASTWALIGGAGFLLLVLGLGAGLMVGRRAAPPAPPTEEGSAELPLPSAPVASNDSIGGSSPEGQLPPEDDYLRLRHRGDRPTKAPSRQSTDHAQSAPSAPVRGAIPPVPSAARGTRTRLPREAAQDPASVTALPPPEADDSPRAGSPTGHPPSTTVESPRSSSSSSRSSSSTLPPTDMPTAGTIPEGALPDEDPAGEERDISMSLYTSRVRSVIRTYYRPRAQTCFERALRNDPQLHGTIVVGFIIGGNGQVHGANVVSNSTGHAEIGSCIAYLVNAWRLPVPPDGDDLQIEMPFSH